MSEAAKSVLWAKPFMKTVLNKEVPEASILFEQQEAADGIRIGLTPAYTRVVRRH